MHEQMPAIAERGPVSVMGHGLPSAQVRQADRQVPKSL